MRDHTTLQKEITRNEEDNRLLKHFCLTDPKDDMDRIEQTKNPLLDGSCAWILEQGNFVKWRNGDTPRYWVNDEPEMDKTMLLIGIIHDILQIGHGYCLFLLPKY